MRWSLLSRLLAPAVALGALICQLLGQADAAAQSAQPHSAPLEAKEKNWRIEHDRLQSEIRELQSKGKLDKAALLIEKMVALAKSHFGEAHEEIAASLTTLALVNEQRGNFPAARKARAAALNIYVKLFGPTHWRVTGPRLALANVDILEKLTAAERANLDLASRLSGLAASLHNKREYAKAEKLYKQALQIQKQLLGEQHPIYAQGLSNLATMHRARGESAQAERLYRQVVEIRKKLLGERHPDYARSLNNLAAVYLDRRDYAKAEPLCRQAMDIRKHALGEQHPDYARSIHNLAALHHAGADYAKAEPLYRQSLAILKQGLGDEHPDCALVMHNLARLYSARADYAQAELLYRQALAIRKKILGESHPDYAQSLHGLAALHDARGDFTRAESLYHQALEIRKKALGEHHRDYARSLNDLAGLYRVCGDFARAEPLYRQAMDIQKKVLSEQHPDYALSLGNLAGLYQEYGDFARAEPLYRQAMAIHAKIRSEQQPQYATYLGNLAVLYHARGDYDRAEPLYLQALEIHKKVQGEKHPEYATCLNNLAAHYQDRGDLRRAGPLYRQALAIRKEVLGEKHPEYALSLHNLAGFYYACTDFAQAELLCRKAGDIRKEMLGEQHPDYAVSLSNLGTVYRARGEFLRAEPLYTKARDILKKTLGKQHPEYAKTLNYLAALYHDCGDSARAAPLYRQALHVVQDHLRRTGTVLSERQLLALAQKNTGFLDSYLSLSVSARLPAADAYRLVLAWKGQAFLQQRLVQLARKLHQADDPEVARLYSSLEDAGRRLAALALGRPAPAMAASAKAMEARQQELTRLSALVESLEQQLANRSQAFRTQLEEERQSLGRLTAALPRNAVLVDFLEYTHVTPPGAEKGPWHFERRLLAFVVQPGGEVSCADLGASSIIGDAVDQWRQSFGMTEAGQKAGRRLRQLVWQPLHDKIQGARLVLLSPDGPLGRFPFAALPGKKEGSYLIEEQPVAVIPVGRLLPALVAETRPKESEQSLLALGDVDFGAEPGPSGQLASSRAAAQTSALPTWSKLDSTRGEILAVLDSFKQRFADGRASLLRGPGATEGAFRKEAPKHRWLHLATHGFFAPPKLRSALGPSAGKDRAQMDPFGDRGVAGFHPGLLSGLVLAGANRPTGPDQDDGILTALEVAALDLGRVELAVLSACETGLGETAGGEGLLGLQRAFQVAGARSVVASLWQVDDKATRALMERFYDNLWAKKMPKLDALRDAQLWMLREGGRRGLDLEIVKGGQPGEPRLPPRYWAAFVLSGDWR
jgi:CHAT domain-containing protein/Flp pilus assembly protein TadD